MMNRLFHTKIAIGNYVLLAALLSVAIYFVWHTDMLTRQGSGLLLTIDLLAMVIIIERMIHSTYTITTDRTLIISKGRFAKKRVISLDEIAKIDRINHWRVGQKPLRTSLVIVLKDNTEYYINPNNEEDFIKCIQQRRKKKDSEE